MTPDTKSVIRIVGRGGVGSYFAKELKSENTEILFFDSRRALNKFNSHSFTFEGKDFYFEREFHISEIADLTLICLKSYEISDELLAELHDLPGRNLFIQNGISAIHRSSEYSKKFIFANIAFLSVDLEETVLSVQGNSPKLLIASNNVDSNARNLITELFYPTDITVKFEDNYSLVLSNKYPRWLLTNLLTISAKQPIGPALINADRGELINLCLELARILAVVLSLQVDVNSLLHDVSVLPPETITSSYRDYFAGKQSEFLMEMGTLLEMADKSQIACPRIKSIIERL